MSNRRTWVTVLLFTVVIINYMDRVALSVAAKPIAAEFGLSPVAMGYLFSSFLWTYVICLIPIGSMVDRVGTKRVIGGGLLLWSVATAFTGLTWNFATILLGRLLMGAGEASSYPGGGRVIRDWIPEGERARVTSLFNGGAVAGPAIGALVVGWLITVSNWRVAFVALGAVGLLWLVAWVVWFGQPEQVRWLSAEERTKILQDRHGRDLDTVHEGAAQSSLQHILSHGSIYGMMLSQATIVYTLYLFLTWMPTYLQTTLHLSVLDTGLFTAIPYAATVVLGFVIAWFSDHALRPDQVRAGGRRFFVFCLMIIGLVILAAPSMRSAVPLLLVMTVVLTACNTASSFNLTLVNDLAENPRDAARITSLVVFGGNICGLLAPIVTGYVVALSGGFDWAFRVAAILLVIGAMLALLLSRSRITAEHAAPVGGARTVPA